MQVNAKIDKRGGSDSHQRVGAQPRNTLTQLTLDTNGGAEDKGEGQTQQRVENIGAIKVILRKHGERSGWEVNWQLLGLIACLLNRL